ncbi:hypothetical protein [Bartonella acomydis]
MAKVLPLQVTGDGDIKTISRVEIVPVAAKNVGSVGQKAQPVDV